MKEYLTYGKAICYSGYRKGQFPKGEAPSRAQIEEDLSILAADGYRYIRMYDPNDHARRALDIIHEKGLPMKAMIGIDSDCEANNPNCPFEAQHYTDEELCAHAERNDRELDRLIALVKAYPDEVAAVSVGNENTPVWGAHLVSEDRLIGHARKLHAALDVPVTFNEGFVEWQKLGRLSREMDIISVHSYPYHMGTPLEEAIAVNRAHIEGIRALYPEHQVIFTEVGWSSNSSIDPATGRLSHPQATLQNERAYIKALQDYLAREKLIGFIFEAFDELWKGDTPEASECNFGLYNEERKPKW